MKGFARPIDVSDLSSVNLGTVFLSDSMEKTLQLVAPQFPEGWLLHSDLNDLPPILGSQSLVDEVFYRAVSQAIASLQQSVDHWEDTEQIQPTVKITGMAKGATTIVKIEENGSQGIFDSDLRREPISFNDISNYREIMMAMRGFFDVQIQNPRSQATSTAYLLYFLNDPKEN